VRTPSSSLLIVVLLAPGCATRTSLTTRAFAPVLPPASARGVVFVADGAGDFQATSRSLRQAVCQQGMPLVVETVPWSHGRLRILADHLDRENLCLQGQFLARRVCSFRQRHPDCPVFLVGHSAGSSVILIATDHLPPGSVERVILTAPAVSICRDLRPALRCARAGVDVFYSISDRGYLGFWVGLMGTSDGRRAPAAGRYGFRPQACDPADAALFGKLRQYPWHPALAWTGHQGGHFGVHQPLFLRTFILPLLRVDRLTACGFACHDP
jgi:pimeloyl-ACP methyl ester carboxylesterase